MVTNTTQKSPVQLEKVLKIIKKRLSKSQAALVSTFSQHFYNSVSESDLINRNAEELYASILSLWNYSQSKVTGSNGMIRVTNPTIEEHGWQSKPHGLSYSSSIWSRRLSSGYCDRSNSN